MIDAGGDARGASQVVEVDLACLEPSELLVMKVTLGRCDGSGSGRVACDALVDSGASTCLVRDKFIGRDREGCGEAIGELVGLGGAVPVLGRLALAVDYPGLVLRPCNFLIVPDGSIKYDIILGQDFLTMNKLVIDTSRLAIRQPLEQGWVEVYLARGAESERVVYCGVPVFAAASVVLESHSPVSVPVSSAVVNSHDCFYDGLVGKPFFSGIPGVVDVSDGVASVLLLRDPSCGRRSGVINKGAFLGTVSTVVDVPVVEQDESESWTRERIVNDIPLNDLSEREAELAVDLLFSQREVLSRSESDIGCATSTEHRIVLHDDTPIRQKPRRFPQPIVSEIERQCEELCNLDIIEPSCSPWASPIVPIRKKDGSIRLCVDYRKLNSVTKPDRFPMPNLSDLVFGLHGMMFFSTLDLVKGYYQIPLEQASRELTAFSTPSNHFQFKRLSFGLKNAPAAFQREMQSILRGFPSRNVVIYIDDVLIMTKSFSEHLELVGRVLCALREHGIKVKPTKCHWFKSSVPFLGHVVSRAGLEKAPEYLRQVLDFPRPDTVHQLRQFLGLVNFQRKFLPHCSEVARSLSSLTGGPRKRKLVWTEEMATAFATLKEMMAEEVKLAFPDYGDQACRLELAVDASGYGAGACLSQVQDGERRIIAFGSMSFSAAQSRYSTIDRELAAIRWGIKYFKSFLFGVPFVLFTDHRPLTYMHNMSSHSSRIARTLQELSEFDFEIRYIRGRDNTTADALSRLPSLLSDRDPVELDPAFLPRGIDVLRRVDGGGDSMVESLLMVLAHHRSLGYAVSVPSSAQELRVALVDKLLSCPEECGVSRSRICRRELLLMRRMGQHLCEEVLLAFVALHGLEVWVHCGMEVPVIYSLSPFSATCPSQRVHLQLLAGCHYNPVCEGEEYCLESRRLRQDNRPVAVTNGAEDEDLETAGDIDVCVSESQWSKVECSCRRTSGPCTTLRFGGKTCCALLDTGAQVCLMRDDVWGSLPEAVRSSAEVVSERCRLQGVGGHCSVVDLVVKLRFDLVTADVGHVFPFAIVNSRDLPFCVLLGANFLKKFQVSLDLYSRRVSAVINGIQFSFSLAASGVPDLATHFCFQHELSSYRFQPGMVGEEELRILQRGNFTLSLLRRRVVEKVDSKLWRRPCLRRFSRFSDRLYVLHDLLWYSGERASVPVVTREFLVEVVVRVHIGMAHVGKHKLVAAVTGQVWHPDIYNVAADVCNSCVRCQMCKVSATSVAPPTIKIASSVPFELLSVDLVDFPVAASGHKTVLMAVDHFSKWLVSVPLKDKRGPTVAQAFQHRVLPVLVRRPDRVLTDNGPEFRSSSFVEVLSIFGIAHSYSTPYCPASNGGVERVNRTIAEILRGLVESCADWDLALTRAVMVYNSTIHRERNVSPSECLLREAHLVAAQPILDSRQTQLWREGHPAFQAFKIGQLVLRRVQTRGNLCTNKLSARYDGPHKVMKVQGNGVTYVIEKMGGRDRGLTRAVHHRQIKRFNVPPRYLSESPAFDASWPDEQFDDEDEDESGSWDFIGFPVGAGGPCSSDSDSGDDSSESSICSGMVPCRRQVGESLRPAASESFRLAEGGGVSVAVDGAHENAPGETERGPRAGMVVSSRDLEAALVSRGGGCPLEVEVSCEQSEVLESHDLGVDLLALPVAGMPRSFRSSSPVRGTSLTEFSCNLSPIFDESACEGSKSAVSWREQSEVPSLPLCTLERPVGASLEEGCTPGNSFGELFGSFQGEFSGFSVGEDVGKLRNRGDLESSFEGFEPSRGINNRWGVLRSILSQARLSIEASRRDSLARWSSYRAERSSMSGSGAGPCPG